MEFAITNCINIEYAEYNLHQENPFKMGNAIQTKIQPRSTLHGPTVWGSVQVKNSNGNKTSLPTLAGIYHAKIKTNSIFRWPISHYSKNKTHIIIKWYISQNTIRNSCHVIKWLYKPTKAEFHGILPVLIKPAKKMNPIWFV